MEKTNKIYKILKIILIVLLIFTMIKSCAKALTYEDVEAYLLYWKSQTDLGSTEWGSNYAVSRLYDYYIGANTKFQNLMRTMDNQNDNFVIRTQNAPLTGTVNIYSTYNYTVNLDSTKQYAVFNYTGQRYIADFTSNNSVQSAGQGSISNNGNQKGYFFISSNYYGTNMTSEILNPDIANQKQWTFIKPRSENAIYTNNNSQIIAFDIRIGQDWNIQDTTIEIYTIDNGIKSFKNIAKTLIQASSTNQYYVEFNVEDLEDDNTYYINLIYQNNIWREGQEGQRIIKTTNPTPTTTTPTPTPSGENQGGSNVDLTATNNKIDNLTNVVQSGDKQIIEAITKLESGEQQRQSFWEKAYNDLFTISGDYITNKFEELREKQKISGDYEIEEDILNLITNNSNDFIISWEDLTTHFTIKGEETTQLTIPQNKINFSQLERDNEDLHTAMEWARTIIGFSLGILLLRNYWTTLLLMLGVGIQVYDKTNDEKESITITTDAKGNKTTTRTFKTGNITQKWVNKK